MSTYSWICPSVSPLLIGWTHILSMMPRRTFSGSRSLFFILSTAVVVNNFLPFQTLISKFLQLCIPDTHVSRIFPPALAILLKKDLGVSLSIRSTDSDLLFAAIFYAETLNDSVTRSLWFPLLFSSQLKGIFVLHISYHWISAISLYVSFWWNLVFRKIWNGRHFCKFS